jgi:molybdate transport system substrate-binding protein
MKSTLDETARAFQKIHPNIKVQFSFGSSGNLFGQVKNGAPFDIFYSADMNYPELLAKNGFAYKGEAVEAYAVGKIVLWSNHRSGVQPAIEKMRSLLNKKVNHIAIANPKHAPYGRAAMEFMKAEKVFEQLKPKLVMGENVTQAAQFAHTGAAQVGIIALSLALMGKMQSAGSFWEVPENLYQPIQQGALLLKNAPNPQAAKSFANFLSGPEGQKILARHGFVGNAHGKYEQAQ